MGRMKKSLIVLVAMCLGIVTYAQGKSVHNTAGMLGDALAADGALTTLTISGTMDVRDFAWLSENVRTLVELDLSACDITAYDSRNEMYMGYRTHFEAQVLPPSSLFAFEQLRRVILPDNIIAIGDGAFAGCTQLEQIIMGAALQEVGDYAFSGCESLYNIEFPATVSCVGDYAFDKCGLSRIDMSQCSNLSYIGKRAFAHNTALVEVVLPTAVATLGDAVFAGCIQLQQVTFPREVMQCGEGLFAAATQLAHIDLSLSNLALLPAWTFSGCMQLTDVQLPVSLVAIGEGAFSYCTQLADVALPEGVNRLAPFAFAGCTQLQQITFLPQGLAHIGRYAFYHNTAADEVHIPEAVAYIGDNAFDGCVNAMRFETLREIPAELGEMVFSNMDVSSKELRVAAGCVDVYKSTAQWQDFGTINGRAAADEVVVRHDIRTLFDNYLLYITAEQPMSDIYLYDTQGVLLSHITPRTQEAVIDTQQFAGNIYVIAITTADGHRLVAKVARIK